MEDLFLESPQSSSSSLDSSDLCIPLLQRLRFPAPELIGTPALTQGLIRAISQYKHDAHTGIDAGPYPIAHNVLPSVFEKWSMKQENCWRLGFFAKKENAAGIVYLFGDPTLLHERITQKLSNYLWAQLAIACQNVCDPDEILEPNGSTRYKINLLKGGYVNKEPDLCYVPSQFGKSFPTLTVELAYKNESYKVLKDEVGWWSVGGCPITIGIKISERKNHKFTLKYIMVDHECGTEHPYELDFSPEIVTDFGQAVERIALRKLMRGQELPNALLNFEFRLDLFAVQKWILRVDETDDATSGNCLFTY